jgi:hypothetical protein
MTRHMTGTREEWLAARLELLEDGVVYHTYSTYARGLDGLWGMYQWLDRAPRGVMRRALGGAVTTSTTRAEPGRECMAALAEKRSRCVTESATWGWTQGAGQ